MTWYEDGNILRMKVTIIPRKHDFAAIVESKNSPIILWHVRYGHLKFGSLSQLQKQEMVKGFPTFKKKNARCKACIYGKQSREPFTTSSWQANKCLQLIHSDICEPLESSLGGCKYLLLFINDFTRMTWV